MPKLPTLLFLLGSMSFGINDRGHLDISTVFTAWMQMRAWAKLRALQACLLHAL